MNKQTAILLLSVSVTGFSCLDTHKDRPRLSDLPAFEKEMKEKLFPPAPAKPVFYISGTYALIEQAGFCTTWDTLWVSKNPRTINSYRVRRKTVFQRNLGDQLFPVEGYEQSWTGSYNAASDKMEAFTEEQVLQVNEARNGVELGGSAYKKIE